MRYTWDEEIGAHDVEVCLPCGGKGADASSRSLGLDVKSPERTRLRVLLDGVLRDEQEGKPIDLQPVRRLVAALVQTRSTALSVQFWANTLAREGRQGACFAGMGFRTKSLTGTVSGRCILRRERAKAPGLRASLGTMRSVAAMRPISCWQT